jgi:hypothetical protein
MMDDLFTPREAAAKLRCSIKTLKAHIASGALRYIQIGRGQVKRHRMIAESDLVDFVHNQTRKESPVPCPSSRINARRIGGSTSSTAIVAFSAQRRPQPNGRPKP